jgi:predicted transcriptional regulator of viral defense system
MTEKTVHSKKGLEIIKNLSEEGKRIFTLKEAEAISHSSSTRLFLHYLAQEGWIVRLKPGVYAIQMPGAQPLHEFEIAMSLVQPAAVIGLP